MRFCDRIDRRINMKIKTVLLTFLLSVMAVAAQAGVAAHQHHPAYHSVKTVELSTGSLRDNVTRIAAEYGWHKIVWLVDNDYRWVGHVTLKKDSLNSVFSHILEDYPLQAVFYKGNHVLVIKARNL